VVTGTPTEDSRLCTESWSNPPPLKLAKEQKEVDLPRPEPAPASKAKEENISSLRGRGGGVVSKKKGECNQPRQKIYVTNSGLFFL